MLKEEFDAMNERKDFSNLLTADEVDKSSFFNQIFGSKDDIQPVGGVGEFCVPVDWLAKRMPPI
jgi:hypothetical protein